MGAGCLREPERGILRPTVVKGADGSLRIRDPLSGAAIRLPAPSPERTRYNRWREVLAFLQPTWHLAGLLLGYFTGLSAWMGAFAQRRLRARWLRLLGVFLAFALAVSIWDLPVRLLAYRLEQGMGFSSQPLLGWARDQAATYLTSLLEAPIYLAACVLLERRPRTWWIVLWWLSIPWTLMMTLLHPYVVEPLFNRFTPVKDEALVLRMRRLAAAAGIPNVSVVQADMSRRTRKLNAYVSGLGPSRRIVLWDTTIAALPPEQLDAVVAHELGHAAEGHVWWRFLFGVAGAFVLLGALGATVPWLVARWGPLYGVRSAAHPAALPILWAALYALMLLQLPVANALSREMERRADSFGVRVSGLRLPTAEVFATFAQRDYANLHPSRAVVFWFYTHPPIVDRIRFVLTYPLPR